MSHELTTRKNGQVEFAYLERDGMPWHGLGTAMIPGQSLDVWRKAAGMDWEIQRAEVQYATRHNPQPFEMRRIPENHVLLRSDTKDALGIVSDKYKVVQPAEILEFFKDILTTGGLELSAAGTIYGGKRFWATAKFGEAAPAAIGDKLRGFLLISTSADGSLATDVRRVTERVVCRNTLAIALTQGQASAVRISHRSVFNPEEVKRYMGLNELVFDTFVQKLEALANTDLKLEQAENAAVSVFGGEQDKVRASAGFNKVMELFTKSGVGAKEDGVYGTAWGFVNAFTEYADHWVRARTDENRFVASQWGAGAQLKQRALEAAEALVGA
jgi:phage/plasmid-like protein (TIGR03299 family)